MLYPYIKNVKTIDIDLKRLYEIAAILEREYLGADTAVDVVNIGEMTNGYQRSKQFALHQQIVKPVISKENTRYINPPTRYFLNKSGNPVSQKLQTYIQELYDQLAVDLFMQKAEHFAALLGTVAYRPVYHPGLKQWKIIELYPSNQSLNIEGHPDWPGTPYILQYKESRNGIEYTITWTYEEMITEWKDTTGAHQIVDEHGLGRFPFELLKYVVDNRRIFGTPDTELYSLCQHRSNMLANAMARAHLSDVEKLVMTGVDLQTAMKNIRERIIALPLQQDPTGQSHQPSAEYISPDGQEALNLIEIYFKVCRHFLDNRGHTAKIYSRGADTPSAEAIRLSSIELYQEQQRKQKYLERFEQGFWQLLIHENNRNGDMKIPEGTVLRVDYKPDPYSFANASDEVTYFTTAMQHAVETPVSWVRHRHPEYSEEEAVQHYEHNKEFSSEEANEEEQDQDQDITDENDEPIT